MILTGLVTGALLGFVLQRGRFCITGAFRDVWLSGSTRWLTAFGVVIALHAIGYTALSALGVVNAPVDPLPLGAAVVGGLIFGVGIIAAGGCATGTYYRAGEGLVGSWFALIFYALSAGAMKYGPLAGFTTWSRDQTVGATTIDASLGLPAWVVVGVLSVGVGLAVRHHLRADAARPRTAGLPARRSGVAHLLTEKRWHPFATAAVVAGIALAAWPLSTAAGRVGSLGITTPSAKLGNYLTTGDLTMVDWSVMLVLGILAGSLVAALASGEFRVRVPDSTTTLRAIGGGVLMGVGASLAGGCTVGHGMVATAQLSWEGWIATGAMLLGAGLGVRWFIRTRDGREAVAGSSPRPTLTPVDTAEGAGADAEPAPQRTRPAPVLTKVGD
ncbi:YeeE/YedE family protein [Kytococcus sedentarius]|uniref:Predicted transporter component n=1 Tax=Kytococcus sedentarius (strain ATCC 14392 / DSM 20547 / JCM 11482 / CCUG 33030 / NBRC 15357 / NCTC 11040 / CCM 314 / 541) TaxID=478801 RepID=C7NII1_KYTSD|nr:YeeE/YedE family protein [Kytococcus sedentarius]ACV05152.1 predicted transporter component [Kytococcus sedentarius DSM 20547]QQB63622.1 YeeE/YedE family protein [Kytococcus sedentarius]STX13444.1 putative inner membrane protein [Kytococcus sedentarius]